MFTRLTRTRFGTGKFGFRKEVMCWKQELWSCAKRGVNIISSKRDLLMNENEITECPFYKDVEYHDSRMKGNHDNDDSLSFVYYPIIPITTKVEKYNEISESSLIHKNLQSHGSLISFWNGVIARDYVEYLEPLLLTIQRRLYYDIQSGMQYSHLYNNKHKYFGSQREKYESKTHFGHFDNLSETECNCVIALINDLLNKKDYYHEIDKESMNEFNSYKLHGIEKSFSILSQIYQWLNGNLVVMPSNVDNSHYFDGTFFKDLFYLLNYDNNINHFYLKHPRYIKLLDTSKYISKFINMIDNKNMNDKENRYDEIHLVSLIVANLSTMVNESPIDFDETMWIKVASMQSLKNDNKEEKNQATESKDDSNFEKMEKFVWKMIKI